MAYAQYLTLSNMVVAKNGTVIYEGGLVCPLLSTAPLDALIAKMNGNSDFGAADELYYWRSNNNTWGDFVTTFENPLLSEYLKPQWIVSQLTTTGDEIHYYNKTKGSNYAFVIRSKTPANGSVYIGHKIGGTYYMDTVNEVTLWQPLSNRVILSYFGWIIDRDNYSAMTYIARGTDRAQWGGNSLASLIVQPYYTRTNYNLYRTGIFNEVSEIPTPTPIDGPYHTDDYTEPIQGDPSYDDSSDTVENPALPTITANASGFVTAFVPTIGEINALANYMISPSFIQALGQTALGGFKDMILGLQVFPCTIPAETPTNLWLYFPGVAVSSGVQMGKASNQFVEIDCGDLEIEEYWGNCCDYNPYTKIGIFLPFCGFYDLDTDDVMGKTLNVSYRVDIMSGACLATIKVDGSIMYQYSGTCSAQIPLNSSSYDEFFKSMIELGTATATGGAGLLAAGASYNTALERSVNMSDKNSFMANAMMDEADAHYDMAKVNTASSLANSTVSNIIGSKAIYKHAGALGSSVGFLGVRKPYLIIKRPYQQIPDMYGKFHGYPCFTKANLNDLTGYTVVDDIRLNIPDATVDEILECEKLLKEGVVL